MISYSTNWMGPASLQWYIDNGFTEKVTKIAKFDLSPSWKAGEPYEYDEIIEPYSGGRIDIFGTGEPYPDEMYLPIMKSEDYYRFRDWLIQFKTETVWTLNQLVKEYETTNPKITWFDYDYNQKEN